jgi:bifunctional non-homologous end joining protein LigD
VKSISLESRQNGSDKVYHVQMRELTTGHWLVDFQYGRRGAALTVGTKTPQPVTLAKAEEIFAKLVSEKKAKGYTESGVTQAAPTGSSSVEIVEEMLPQLLTEISEPDAEKYITDDDYCAQEKLDGRNKTLRNIGGVVTSANKKGQIVPTPAEVADYASRKFDFIAQAEHVGSVYHVHSLTMYRGQSVRALRYDERLARAVCLFPFTKTAVRVVETAGTTAEKRSMFKRLKKENREGIVFKRKDAPFTEGRSESQVKVKFWASLSARIRTIRPGGRESIECELLNTGGKVNFWQTCGNVTVLKRGLIDTLRVGSIVEIRYLYAVRGSDILYQPSPCMTGDTFIRDDVMDNECTTRQLKYKPEAE